LEDDGNETTIEFRPIDTKPGFASGSIEVLVKWDDGSDDLVILWSGLFYDEWELK